MKKRIVLFCMIALWLVTAAVSGMAYTPGTYEGTGRTHRTGRFLWMKSTRQCGMLRAMAMCGR